MMGDPEPPANAAPSRSHFATRIGAICAIAGVAIGLGNVWRFPYMMGRDGGSAFLLLYIVFMLAIGVPALMVELALGRTTRRGPWGAYERAGMRWGRLVSVMLLVTITMAASYYGVVVAWVLQQSVALSAAAEGSKLLSIGEFTDSVSSQLVYLVLTVGIGVAILAFGVRRGIERASRAALLLFVIIFVVVLVRVLRLDGAMAGLRQFLKPNVDAIGWSTALSAMGQVVFSLGLGGMFMVLYGSYMRDDENIPAVALATVGADLGAALLAGFIVMPAVFAMGVDPAAGSKLLFESLPGAFALMPGGLALGAAFFFAIFVVALMSLIAAYEAIIASLTDGFGWTRQRALAVVAVSQVVLAVPAYFIGKYIDWSDFIWGTTMQPLGAVMALVGLTWALGRTRTLEEIRRSSKLPVPGWLFVWTKYVLPAFIIVVLVAGWLDKFGEG